MRKTAPQVAYCAACLDERPFGSRPSFFDCLLAGLWAGDVLWLFAPLAPPTDGSGGLAVFARGVLGVAVPRLWGLRRGLAIWLCGRDVFRRRDMGSAVWDGSFACFCGILEGSAQNCHRNFDATGLYFEKNI